MVKLEEETGEDSDTEDDKVLEEDSAEGAGETISMLDEMS